MKRVILAFCFIVLLSFDNSGYAQHGHGSKVKIPDTISEMMHAVDEHLGALDQLIVKGELHRVHKIAFETRDLLFALPAKVSPSELEEIKLNTSLKKIKQQAGLLDKYGDAGNARLTKVVLKKFKEEIETLKTYVANR